MEPLFPTMSTQTIDISVIVAGCIIPNDPKQLGIGLQNPDTKAFTMPWNLPEEMKHFRNTTSGHVMLVGRNTFETFGGPLPSRLFIVVTSNWAELEKQKLTKYDQNYTSPFVVGVDLIINTPSKKHNYIKYVPSVAAGLDFYADYHKQYPEKRLFVIGGAKIYDYVLNHYPKQIKCIIITKIDHPFPCSIYFPYAKYAELLTKQAAVNKTEHIPINQKTEIDDHAKSHEVSYSIQLYH